MKFLLLSIFISTALYASSLNDKISIFLTQKEQQINSRFLTMIFANTNPSVTQVYQILDKNNLLKDLKTRDYDIVFSALDIKSDIVFIKIILQTLSNMGISQITPIHTSYADGKIEYELKLKLKYLNFVLLKNELYKQGIKIVNFYKSGKKIISKLTGFSMKIKAIIVTQNTKLPNSRYPYFINISANTIILKNSLLWYPNITIYDNQLRTIKHISKSKRRNITIELPNNTKYINISSKFNKAKFINGLNIEILN